MPPKKGKGGKKREKAKPPPPPKLYWTKRAPPPFTPNAYGNREWHEVQTDIVELIQEEEAMFKNKKGKPIEPKPIKSRPKAFYLCADRYLKYILIAKRMDDCFSYMVHPQKRQLVKLVLIHVLARVLEMKDQMMLVEQREYHFIDDIIQDFRLIPQDVDLKLPRYFRDERVAVLQARQHILESILQKYGLDSEKELKVTPSYDDSMTIGRAVQIIQRNHRGFMGRLKFDNIFRSRTLYGRRDLMPLYRRYYDRWKCYVYRNRAKQMRLEEMQDLGMMPVEDEDFSSLTEAHYQRNKKLAAENLATYEMDMVLTEENMYQQEGPDMAWSLKYNITQLLLECRDFLGQFPVFPPAEKGGSNLLFSTKSVEEVEAELQAMMDEMAKKKGKKKKKKKEKKKKEKKGKKKKGKKDEEEEFVWVIPKSEAVPGIQDGREAYLKYWYYKDEGHNMFQNHDRELMKEDLRLKVAETIRLQVDELMRFEIENMKVAIDKAKRAKTDGVKKGKKGGKKKKKKGKKGKKGKDLTKGRTIEDLYEELVMNGIIRKCEPVSLNDFLGDYSYTGCYTQEAGLNPLPSLADIRKLVTELAVIPLGSEGVHSIAPLNRSMLIAGVRGTGKNMLVNAICYESGANLFDIRPSNLVGKYDGKAGMKMIMHLIMKVGKALEPSVFWIDECERMFLKKKDKKDKSKPHKWVKLIKKTIKQIKKGDRMMLIGTAKRPSLCKRGLNRFFQRTVIVPHPDYGSRMLMWKHFIAEYSGNIPHDMDLTSLTKVTTGFTVQAIKKTCESVLTKSRLELVDHHPLETIEFARMIATFDPIYRAEHLDFLKWYEKTPWAKTRMKRLGLPSAADMGKGKKGDNGKKGKKGNKGKKGKKGGKGGGKKKKKK